MTNSKVTREQFERFVESAGIDLPDAQATEAAYLVWQEAHAQGFAAGLEAAAKVCADKRLEAEQYTTDYYRGAADWSGACEVTIRALKGNQHE